MILKPKNRDEWLAMRFHGIGGSDAGAVVGVNKYRDNILLWQEKTGEFVPDDISDKPAVKFGKEAEKSIRELFKLDYPEYEVDYHEFDMYVDDAHPFMFATLDGEITDKDGLRGILEIKTTTILNKSQWLQWDDKIPDSYYVQILHQLACTGWQFAILRAYIRYHKDGELRATVRDYRIERTDVEEDIQWLIEKEAAFWDCVKQKRKPNLILPQI